MDTKKLYKDYLQNVKLMQLATCVENQPWLCNVWFVQGTDENIYWCSRKTRRHSIEIEQNPYVSCTFHQEFTEGLGQKGQAVVMAGQAKLLEQSKISKIYDLYHKRYPKLPSLQSKDIFQKVTGDHFFYQMTPTEVIWWDEVNFPGDPRQRIL